MENHDILTNIRKILRSINLESKRIQKNHGVSIPQLLCLNYLNSTAQLQSTVKELSFHLNLNSSTVSGIVKRLEAKGLIAKLPNPRDRRGSIIAITQKGSGIIAASPLLLHDKLDQRLAKMPPEDFETIQNGLNLLVRLLGIEEVDASPLLVPEESIVEGENVQPEK